MVGSKTRAVVVLSGGQDSTTCLFWAKREYTFVVRAVSFDYGQRHRAELNAAREIAAMAGVPHEVIKIEGLRGGALTEPEIPVAADGGFNQLPTTFLPGRNLVFLCLAASVAARYASAGVIPDLVTGVCQTDYSGYPDCRRRTIDALELALDQGINGGTGGGPRIATPLMHMTKAETVRLARDLGCFDALAKSVTCYHGRVPGCGECPACVLRAKGFEEAGERDPAR